MIADGEGGRGAVGERRGEAPLRIDEPLHAEDSRAGRVPPRWQFGQVCCATRIGFLS